MILSLPQRINAFHQLGEWFRQPDDELAEIMNRAVIHNAWFTPKNVQQALAAWGNLLTENQLNAWSIQWQPLQNKDFQQKKIGLILAGNIPLVGFHDLLCALLSGHIAIIKLSSQDQYLIQQVIQKLLVIQPALKAQINLTEKLENIDAIIATGSNNTSRYFEYYFGKYPHIIRKNRNSIAVLTGQESEEELKALGSDIFQFFGLGCRNVSKLYIPKGFDVANLFNALAGFKDVGDHHKYINNYDYYKSIYLINGEEHVDNGFLLIKPDKRIATPLAVLHYEEYKDIKSVRSELLNLQDQIQCIVTKLNLDLPLQVVTFGESQHPGLADYADNVDTMKFLVQL